MQYVCVIYITCMNGENFYPAETGDGSIQANIESLICSFRGHQVMIDRDIAMLYGVETKALNQAVKRNIERFPERFRFQLSVEETSELVTVCDRFKSLKHSSVMPYAFTEQGISMLSTVLHSKTAIEVSIQIMDAFVAMRHYHCKVYSFRDRFLTHTPSLKVSFCLPLRRLF